MRILKSIKRRNLSESMFFRVTFLLFLCMCFLGCEVDSNSYTLKNSSVDKEAKSSGLSNPKKPPFNNSISIDSKTHQEKFKWILEQANIPYKTIDYKGREWITWPEEYSQIVDKLRNRAYEKSDLGRARIALDTGNYEQGIKLLMAEANKGNPKAQANLAFEYSTGKYVEKDYGKAYALYLKAANSGHSEAYANIGLMHEQGRGVSKNCEQAALWFEKGAQVGEPYAMWKFGKYLQQGKCGLSKSEDKANYWFKKVKSMGYNFP